MKKIAALFLCLSMFFCGCDAGYNRHSAGAQGHNDLLRLVSIAVPHIEYMDLRLDHMDVLETDPYGRVLFCYNFAVTHQKWLVVCQKVETSKIYYYEDYCYLLCSSYEDPVTTDEVDWIKEKNDWGLPLNESKMQSVSYNGEKVYEDILDKSKVERVIEEYAKTLFDSEFIVSINGLEVLETGYQVILTDIYLTEEKLSQYYLILFDYSAEGSIVAVEEIEDMTNIRESIIQFKFKHGAKNGFPVSSLP